MLPPASYTSRGNIPTGFHSLPPCFHRRQLFPHQNTDKVVLPLRPFRPLRPNPALPLVQRPAIQLYAVAGGAPTLPSPVARA